MSQQAKDRHNENGEEILDPVPMQPPVGYKKTLSLAEQIRQQVRLHKMELEDNSIQETEEEADDFEVGEDYEPLSKYENDHIPSVKQLKQKAKEINAARERAIREKAIKEYEEKHGKPAPVAPATEKSTSLPEEKQS